MTNLLEAALRKIRWNADARHDENVRLTPHQCEALAEYVAALEEVQTAGAVILMTGKVTATSRTKLRNALNRVTKA